MEYTNTNFKKEGEAVKKTTVSFMKAKEEGFVDTAEGSLNVHEGNYIIQGFSKGKPRVWVVDEEYFNSNYAIKQKTNK